MDKKALLRRLMATFRSELDESRQALNTQLVAFEALAPGTPEHRELVQTLMRTAHNLKGAARSVEQQLIGRACHQFEELISRSTKQTQRFSPEVFKQLFATLDGLGEASAKLLAGENVEGGLLGNAVDALDALVTAQNLNHQQADDPKTDTLKVPDLPPPLPQTPTEPPVNTGLMVDNLSVRVGAEKLDELLRRSGELRVMRRRLFSWEEQVRSLKETVGRHRRASKAPREVSHGSTAASTQAMTNFVEQFTQQFQEIEKRLEQSLSHIEGDRRALDQVAEELDDQVRQVRMLPFVEVCHGLDRTVRDLAQAQGKTVELKIVGRDVELDRSVLQELKHPLVHLIRNAVDHGIESPQARAEAKKPPVATIEVAATMKGGRVEVSVADDGRGLDVEAIRKRAQQMKLPIPEDNRDLGQVLFSPGFSTATTVTDISGRGVGLDVVKTQLEALHGTVKASFEPGAGTRFVLSVPLTLTMIRVLLVTSNGITYALPSNSVNKLLRLTPNDFHEVSGRTVLRVGDVQVASITLGEALGFAAKPVEKVPSKIVVVVVSSAHGLLALVVDELLAEQEVMIESLGSRIKRLKNVAGATILPGGKIALTLNVADLMSSVSQLKKSGVISEVREKASIKKKRHKLLVIDDSVTTRSLEKSILEAAGYLVNVASDGLAGLEQLEAHGADLVLVDAEMPRMNGFEFVAAVRSSDRFNKLPVIIVTSLADEQSKAKGMQAGASGYVVKGSLEQARFLRLVEQLL